MSVYNDGKFLREAVESILAQTFGDFEFLVVDDGSTDSTIDVLRAIPDQRVRIISTSHVGLASALNLAIGQARGEYIARQDADDISHVERLQRQVEFLWSHESIGYVGTGLVLINEDGESIRKCLYPSDPFEIRRLLDGGQNPFVHPSLMFRTVVLRACGGYDESFKKTEDYDLHLRLTEHCQASNISEVLLSYRVRMDSMSVCGSADPLRYQLFARMLADIRQGEFANPGGLNKEALFSAFQKWFDHEKLDRIHNGVMNRRRALLAYAQHRFVRAALYAGMAAVQDLDALSSYVKGTPHLLWNRRRRKSLQNFLAAISN